MTPLQKEYLKELESHEILTVSKHAAIYQKYNKLAIEQEYKKGASDNQAKTMGDYYVFCVLSDFIVDEYKVDRIVAFKELEKKS